MARYPLEYGWQTSSDPADGSRTSASSTEAEPYPLEWGSHLDPPQNDAGQTQVFTPVMTTLLGGANPGRDTASQEKPPQEVWQQCHDECERMLFGRGGIGPYRRCVRECLGKKGDYDYLVDPNL